MYTLMYRLMYRLMCMYMYVLHSALCILQTSVCTPFPILPFRFPSPYPILPNSSPFLFLFSPDPPSLTAFREGDLTPIDSISIQPGG